MSEHPNSSPRDRAFQSWLKDGASEDPARLEAFLAAQPEALRADLRCMIEDYRTLREAIGEQGPGHQVGRVLGDYRLLQEIGRGGVGTVWEAEQLSLKRPIALKLLKPQFSFSPTLLERFQREAEAGGRLRHQGIVQTYAVGETDGIHWIAQELVPGGDTLADDLARMRRAAELPADRYPRMAERFAEIADALEAAHAAGVVHRDIKPGNILLDAEERAKVADFGLAKIAEDLSLSRTGEFAGTPFYMSPEQATSKRMGIDHRTDIFSLGATMYEALTLTRAFDGDTSQQVFQKILTEEPPDPRRLRGGVPRDLAVICAKCLEKSPDRRYSSMAALAADLRRYQAHEPIHATPPSRIARFGKWCRRHPVVASSASVAVLALLAISSLAWRLAEQRDDTAAALEEVRLEATTSERVIEFVVGLFWTNSPDENLGRTITARELLDRAAAEIEQELAPEPEILARLLDVIGRAYQALGLYPEAEVLLRKAWELRHETLGPDDPDTLTSLNNLGSICYYAEKFGEAERLFRLAWEGSRRVNGPDASETLASLTNLGLIVAWGNHPEEALPLQLEAVESSRRINGERDPDTLMAVNNYGLLLQQLGRQEEAEPFLKEAWILSHEVNGENNGATLTSKNNYALLLQELERFDEAESMLREVLAAREEIFDMVHPQTLTVRNNLGLLLRDRGQLIAAEEMLRETLAQSRQALGPERSATLITLGNLGLVLRDQQRWDEADVCLRGAWEGNRRVLGAENPGTAASLENLVRLNLLRGALAEGANLGEELMRITPEGSDKRQRRQALLDEIRAALAE